MEAISQENRWEINKIGLLKCLLYVFVATASESNGSLINPNTAEIEIDLFKSAGFSNSICSPAIEFKKEGIIYGICVKMFTIAGPVIVCGVVGSIICGIFGLFI